MKPKHLYLHVPFCASICSYCDFCRRIYNAGQAELWLQAVKKEIDGKRISGELETVYIGGGTPSCLSAVQLDSLLGLLDPYTACVQEYTIEINPETLNQEKAEILRKHGISRASIGMQTSDPALLKEINRHHTPEQVGTCMSLLRQCGIENISLDLMYSLPGQTMTVLQKSVMDAIALKPSHLSLYSLTIEPNSVFGKKKMQPLDEDTEADMYEWICRTLPTYGYRQYEISNFCLQGRESRHNCAYWNYRDFYGISVGASGKEGYMRYDNTRSLSEYLKNPFARNEIHLSEADASFEMIMMSLRLKKGLDRRLFYETFHKEVQDIYGDTLHHLQDEHLISVTDERICCTERGYEILNDVLEEFLP